MKVVIQKINYARLTVEDKLVSEVGHGLLVTIGVHRDDTIDDAKYLAHKVANLRMFKDDNGKINLSVLDTLGECMVVSNFSLTGEIQSGNRPNFSKCAAFEMADDLYKKFGEYLKAEGVKKVEYGMFRHHMHIECELDGPFNFIFDTKKE